MASATPSSYATSYGSDVFAFGKSPSVSIPNSHLRQGPAVSLLSPPGSVQSSAPVASVTHQVQPNNDRNRSYGMVTPSSSISPTLQPVYSPGSAARQTSGDHLGVTTPESDHSLAPSHPVAVSYSPPQGYYPASSSLLAAQNAGSPITPSLLAKHYLPDILLQHGPLAIRHLTAYLIASIPGFSNIPPAKQRRLVVGALEGRGGSSGTGESSGALAAGGVNGDVIFEKVGWGRWDARKKGDPPRENVPRGPNQGIPGINLMPPAMDGTPMSPDVRNWNVEQGIFMHSEDERSRRSISPLSSPAEEADKMSMDEDVSMRSSSSEDDDADVTDEEDWAKMGAEMLRRQASPINSDAFSAGGVRSAMGSPNVQILYGSWGASGSSFPHHRFQSLGHAESFRHSSTQEGAFGYWDNGEKRNREEQEAIEALVKLSSI